MVSCAEHKNMPKAATMYTPDTLSNSAWCQGSKGWMWQGLQCRCSFMTITMSQSWIPLSSFWLVTGQQSDCTAAMALSIQHMCGPRPAGALQSRVAAILEVQAHVCSHAIDHAGMFPPLRQAAWVAMPLDGGHDETRFWKFHWNA